MIYTVYLDMLFLVNLVMNAVVLTLVKRLMGFASTRLRILLAGAAGALWVCLITVWPFLPVWLENLASYVLLSGLMVAVAFRPGALAGLVKGIAALYMVSFTVGGLFYAVYAHTRLGYYISLLAQGEIREALPFMAAAAMALAAYFFCRFFWEKHMENRRAASNFYQVVLFYRGKRATLKGLMDTGNGLWDPGTKKPVCVADYEACREIFEKVDNIRYVPFQAVGTKDGLLPAVIIDRMELEQGDRKMAVERPMIAIYRHSLSADGRYQMLIHPGLLSPGESNGT